MGANPSGHRILTGLTGYHGCCSNVTCCRRRHSCAESSLSRPSVSAPRPTDIDIIFNCTLPVNTTSIAEPLSLSLVACYQRRPPSLCVIRLALCCNVELWATASQSRSQLLVTAPFRALCNASLSASHEGAVTRQTLGRKLRPTTNMLMAQGPRP